MKMVAASEIFPQVASNNGGGTQAPPLINCGTAPDTVGGLHHMGAVLIDSQYAVQTKSLCEHHNNYVSDPKLTLFIADLKKA